MIHEITTTQDQSPETLTELEQERLTQIEIRAEELIKTSKEAFIELGAILREIRDGKLYRSRFRTFESYIETTWKMSQATAYRLMESSEASDFFLSHREELTQSAANEVLSYHRLDQQKVAAQVERMAPAGKKITRTTVEKAAKVVHAEKKVTKKTVVEVSAAIAQPPRGGLAGTYADKGIDTNPLRSRETVQEAEVVPSEPASTGKAALLAELDAVQAEYLSVYASWDQKTVRALMSKVIELVNKYVE